MVLQHFQLWVTLEPCYQYYKEYSIEFLHVFIHISWYVAFVSSVLIFISFILNQAAGYWGNVPVFPITKVGLRHDYMKLYCHQNNIYINSVQFKKKPFIQLFRDGGPYHIETSPLVCKANQWTGFYIIGTSVLKELNTEHQWVLYFR